MNVSLFDYRLPQELIAQKPTRPRDASRLMVLRRPEGRIEHDVFRNLPSYLRAGDCLVVNETRVIPARLLGRKAGTGGRVEVLLLRPRTDTIWEALVKPGRRLAPGAGLLFGDGPLEARIVERLPNGGRLVEFAGDAAGVADALKKLGRVPLPPYVHEPLDDDERYQTVYSTDESSVAAPTAGLHFTRELLDAIRQLGVDIVTVRLSVGLDTFRPVTADQVEDHAVHSEEYEIDEPAAAGINQAHARGARVIAVGTTTTRVLETVAAGAGTVCACAGETRLFIYPGHEFKVVDAMITNFHLPRSSLLMLVSAFAGREPVMNAYEEAIAQRYRFFSFGDAMLII